MSSPALRVDLKERAPISGDITLREIKLEDLLDALKAGDQPARLNTSGTLKVNGFLASPLEITGDLKAGFTHFVVVKDEKKPTTDQPIPSLG